MKRTKKYTSVAVLGLCFAFTGCKMLNPEPIGNSDRKPLPGMYTDSNDSTNSAQIKWKDFFADKNLESLIDTALNNNPDLMIAMQDIEIAKNNVRLKKGQLLPTVNVGVEASVDKVGRYTSEGAGDAITEITPGKLIPDPLPDYTLGLSASWEIDVWKKLRNEKKAAYAKYLGSVEGRNFVVTNLVAEIANSYYELLALDNQLDIVRQTIDLQQRALEIVKTQKEASQVTELAVKRFEAEVLNSQSMEFDLLQQIKENENKINFLLGRFPQPIVRDKSTFMQQLPPQIKAGIPSQLLVNRPDIKAAEMELYASKCDVKAAQAEFYPSFEINAGAGLRAFNPSFLFTTPESMIYSVLGGLTAPLINRSAIKAEFKNAKAYQIQAMYDYQKTILEGYVEVSNELSNIDNLNHLYELKNKEVDALVKSIDVSDDLFKYGKADYFEVLMTQRDALESKLELVETKKRQMNALTNIYQALGGGWN